MAGHVAVGGAPECGCATPADAEAWATSGMRGVLPRWSAHSPRADATYGFMFLRCITGAAAWRRMTAQWVRKPDRVREPDRVRVARSGLADIMQLHMMCSLKGGQKALWHHAAANSSGLSGLSSRCPHLLPERRNSEQGAREPRRALRVPVTRLDAEQRQAGLALDWPAARSGLVAASQCLTQRADLNWVAQRRAGPMDSDRTERLKRQTCAICGDCQPPQEISVPCV